jgi:predicted RNA binding protein YcfA (HicA-like mRNA interferase family)
MKAISGEEFAKLLENNGWFLARINGSHHIYMKD